MAIVTETLKPGPWKIRYHSDAYLRLEFIRDRPDLGDGMAESRHIPDATIIEAMRAALEPVAEAV